jgi:hypothetical protein
MLLSLKGAIDGDSSTGCLLIVFDNSEDGVSPKLYVVLLTVSVLLLSPPAKNFENSPFCCFSGVVST